MKIIKAPKFKKITCTECGCVYEYEKGDEVSHTIFPHSMGLHCPICGFTNHLDLEESKECAKRTRNDKIVT